MLYMMRTQRLIPDYSKSIHVLAYGAASVLSDAFHSRSFSSQAGDVWDLIHEFPHRHELLPVPEHIPRPPYARSGILPKLSKVLQIQDQQSVAKMRHACQVAARSLAYAGSLVKPGITTNDLDRAVHDFIIAQNAYPSPLNYGGFPKSICASVNDCVVHGIPDDTVIQDNDIVKLDVSVYIDGYHGDTCAAFIAGQGTEASTHLVDTTYQALSAAIAICRPGVAFSEVGHVIQAIADQHKLGVVREFAGHGVGTVLHAEPLVYHYANSRPGTMQVGQTFTIEPMLTLGDPRTRKLQDGWTVVTLDGSLSAQWEHTLMVTDSGVEVLTLREGEKFG